MKRLTAPLVVLLGSVFVIGAQVRREWIKYTSTDGRYEVALPQEPTLSTQDTIASTGEKLPQYLASSGDGNGGFLVAWFDYRGDMTFSIDKARDKMLEGVHGTALSEEAVSLAGSPGKQVTFVAASGDGDFIDRARFYDINRRVYILQCIFPKAEDNADIKAKCAEFFDSFRLQPSR